MVYRPADALIYALAWRRRGERPLVIYAGDDKGTALEALYSAIEGGAVSCGKVVRTDGSLLYVVDPPAR